MSNVNQLQPPPVRTQLVLSQPDTQGNVISQGWVKWFNNSQIFTNGSAPLKSPAFTGTPTSTTPPALSNNSTIATSAYVDRAVAVETARAKAAEAAEKNRALAAEGALSASIAAETSRAEGVEATLAPINNPNFSGTVGVPTLNLTAGTVGTATAGAATLPANPVAFVVIDVAGTPLKVALYNL